jgi:hypothetical protein
MDETLTLAEVGYDDLRELTVRQLLVLARRNELDVSTRTRKAELVRLLRAVLAGGDKSYVHGRTLCGCCRGETLACKATRRGRRQRYMVCRRCGYARWM